MVTYTSATVAADNADSDTLPDCPAVVTADVTEAVVGSTIAPAFTATDCYVHITPLIEVKIKTRIT